MRSHVLGNDFFGTKNVVDIPLNRIYHCLLEYNYYVLYYTFLL